MANRPSAQKRPERKGNKPEKFMRDAIILALHREAGKGKTKKLYKIADKLVDKAMEGDIMAIKEINDRVDGKAPQDVNFDGSISYSGIPVPVSERDPLDAPARPSNGSDPEAHDR